VTDVEARGPYFDELRPGQVFDTAPGVTLTAGAAAVHQAIVGDRLALATDHELGRAVLGGAEFAHPAHVWDVAIGQSTVATQFVRANLFYRGLVFRRFPVLGDTLHTRTEVVGLRQNSTREGRPRTGLAALHITTRDQRGAAVLDFHRCAMLPLSPGSADTGHAPVTRTTCRGSAPSRWISPGPWRGWICATWRAVRGRRRPPPANGSP
jgi:acyl dehydratase